MVSVKINSYEITPGNSGEAYVLGRIYKETNLLYGYDPVDDSYKISNEDEKNKVLELFKEKMEQFKQEENQGGTT